MNSRNKQVTITVRKLFILVLLIAALNGFGQKSSIGLYAGYGADKVSNPYDFRMKPVFELGAIYNQRILFNLSVVIDLGFNSERIVSNSTTPGFIPAQPDYTYLNADLFLRYWILNDIKAFRTGKRSNERIQAEIMRSPFNLYLTGGIINELLIKGSGDDVESSVSSAAMGAGIQFYMPTSNKKAGVSPFFELLSTRNLTPRFTSATDELIFSRWLLHLGLTYSFSQP